VPDLILGPMLRYVDENTATVWVETSAPCEVELRGSPGIDGVKSRTFEVRGQHYALVVADGLEGPVAINARHLQVQIVRRHRHLQRFGLHVRRIQRKRKLLRPNASRHGQHYRRQNHRHPSNMCTHDDNLDTL